ncbi:helix-turn-helix domain-containing protein [Pseudofrankia sp. BMG5.37]|uniref:helix-turn-helix domain-containing protein n=1 Tax=Pseudofrankia sp. BMG5.37 TaxID=3050035 RepID=UPI00289568EC|nr:helix-turn-helix domain-containing protein [Pseudofrankia sp. BMG5.37]MDT3438733.1 helix-turn-helix domain-containing protein [Pseudofrankia sp. BMG5.37]
MPDDFLVRFGAAVRQARRRQGMTQAELADRLGLARTSISNIESGAQNLPIGTLPGLAAALGAQADRLVREALGLPTSSSRSPLDSVEDLRLKSWAAQVISGSVDASDSSARPDGRRPSARRPR